MYTYAFFKTPIIPLAALPDGIAGTVQIINSDDLSALVEPGLALEALQEKDDLLVQAVLAHDRVICELFRQTTVLPLRFGTSFASLERLLAQLSSHRDEYLSKLSQVEGKAEYTLKLTPVELSSEPSSTETETQGRDYFLAKKRRYQTQLERQNQQQAERQQVMEAIASTYPNLVLGEAQGSVERIYLLCDRQEEPLLQQHLQGWEALCSQWQLHLGEALPPYHFV